MAEIVRNYASGIILIRPGLEGQVEVYMVQGQRKPSYGDYLEFLVSPVRKSDFENTLLKRCRGLSPVEARQILGSSTLKPSHALSYWVAGIRGISEQLGLLISVPGRFNQNTVRRRAETSVDFKVLLELQGLRCDLSRLQYFSHWLTESKDQQLTDTRYFLAFLRPDEISICESAGRTEHCWINPERALELVRGGSLKLAFSTFAMIRKLADFDSCHSLMNHYRVSH